MANILLVEDDSTLREAFGVILSLENHIVTPAGNGKIAIDLCKEHTYDLILLDVMMPVMDGLGFLKEYTDNYPDVSTKVIVMSNLSSGAELSITRDFGVEKVVLKSTLTPKLLLQTVSEVIDARQLRRETATDQTEHIPTGDDTESE